MPKISVVVPVFGVEKYIERCARSLFSQTLEDIEFIFVNDCTEDRSMEILQGVIDEFKPSQVKILNHLENMGLPQARRTGMAAATGEYIANCDSDDWVEPEYCESLYHIAKEADADMAICGFRYAGDKDSVVMRWGDEKVYDNPEETFRHILAERLPINVWCRIIRREIAQRPEIEVPVCYSAEDWTYVVQWAYYAKKMVFDSSPLYNYYVGNASESRSLDPQKCMRNCIQKRDNVKQIRRWLAQKECLCRFREEIVSVQFLTKAMLFPVIDNSACRHLWRKVFRSVNIRVLMNNYVTRKEKSRHFKYLFGSFYPVIMNVVHIFVKYE